MGTSASEIFDLRNFYFYSCGNSFTGSLNNFNYKIVPKDDELTAFIWHGMLCSDLAKMENEKKFPFDEDGFEKMVKWLEEEYQKQL